MLKTVAISCASELAWAIHLPISHQCVPLSVTGILLLLDKNRDILKTFSKSVVLARDYAFLNSKQAEFVQQFGLIPRSTWPIDVLCQPAEWKPKIERIMEDRAKCRKDAGMMLLVFCGSESEMWHCVGVSFRKPQLLMQESIRNDAIVERHNYKADSLAGLVDIIESRIAQLEIGAGLTTRAIQMVHFDNVHRAFWCGAIYRNNR